MTVNAQTGVSPVAIGNGVTTVFPFDFQIGADDEIVVYADGVEVSPSGYTVSRENDWTGDVTFDVAPASGVEIVLASDPTFDQQSVHLRQGPFYADVVEDDLDKAAIRDIYLDRVSAKAASDIVELADDVAALQTDIAVEQAISVRSLLAPVGETGYTFPLKAARVAKFFGTAANGDFALYDLGSIAKGDPGGNAMAVGVFTDVPTLNIPVGTDVIQTTGYATRADGGLARYVYDPAIDAAYVTAHPRAAILTANARGFRLAEAKLDPKMFGSAAGTGWVAAASWAAFTGLALPLLEPVSKFLRAPATWDMPASFNDQIGGTRVVFDGVSWRFETSRWSALDFRQWSTYTTYYLNYARPNDAGDGLSSGNAKKTWKALTDLIRALPASTAVEIVCENAYIGVNSYAATQNDWADGKHVVVRSVHASGHTAFVNMNESKTQAGFAFVAHGASGAWKCPIANAGGWVAGFYTGQRDLLGVGLPIVSAGMSAALVETTELTQFSDGAFFYIHLPGGVKPDPVTNPAIAAGNWEWCDNTGGGSLIVKTASGTFLTDGVGGFVGAVGVATTVFAFLPASDAAPNTTSRVGVKNGRVYGTTSFGAVSTQGARVVVVENMVASHVWNDHYNYKKRGVAGADGTIITVYEERVLGRKAGYTGFAYGLGASSSNNGSTAHDSMSIVRCGSRFFDADDAMIADVDGCDSVNFGVQIPRNATGAGSFYPSAFVYEANTGVGLRRRMILIGCGADNAADTNAIQLAGSAADAVIYIDRWQGEAGAKLRIATVGQTIRAYADSALLCAVS